MRYFKKTIFVFFKIENMKVEKCEILKTGMLGENILEIMVENKFTDVKVGQFFNIKPSDESLILRRPISINKFGDKFLNFVIRIEGKGTKLLLSKKVGDVLDILGPLGNGFKTDIKNSNVLLIGGGVGAAPLVQLGKDLDSSCKIFSKLGFQSSEYQIEDFMSFSNSVDIYLEKKAKVEKKYNDNVNTIYNEFPTLDLDKFILDNKIDAIYTCGPEIMMSEVFKISEKTNKDIVFYASLEERMACGIGACLCCTKKTSEETSVCVCKEGPVFEGNEVFK